MFAFGDSRRSIYQDMLQNTAGRRLFGGVPMRANLALGRFGALLKYATSILHPDSARQTAQCRHDEGRDASGEIRPEHGWALEPGFTALAFLRYQRVIAAGIVGLSHVHSGIKHPRFSHNCFTKRREVGP